MQSLVEKQPKAGEQVLNYVNVVYLWIPKV
jgi:hypothetical protein